MLFHPEVAFRDCDHCQDYLYDETTGKVKMFHGEPVERLPSVPAPCRCKGCPKGTPERQKVLSPKNYRTYGYYGGYWGGPFGFFGTPWNGDFRDYYAGPYGYNIDLWTGPYVFDEDGNPGSTYNAGGFDANGFDKNGYDPNGYDINGLDINGKTRGYYGRWGHFHLLSESPAEHANDHGVEYYAGSEQVIPAGTLGVAVNVGGSGYVAVAIEERAIFIDYAD